MLKVQEEIREFLTERDWVTDDVAGYVKSISIEAAELLEHFQWSEPTATELRKDPEKLEKVKKELADILIYSLDLAVMLGADAEEIIRAKMAHNGKKYAVHLVKGKQGAVKDIQKEWRAKGIN